MDNATGITFGEWETLFRLILALLFGGLIGLERQAHGRPAGLRTNILVCLGAAAIIVAFQKLSTTLHPGTGTFIRMDPARAAAGIITGIGFIGAGTIMRGKHFIIGITTAASIWVVAAIGITLGLGHYLISIEVTALVLLTLFVLERIPHWIKPDLYKEVRAAGAGGTELYEKVRSQLRNLGLVVKDSSLETQSADGTTAVSFIVQYKDEAIGPQIINALSRIDNVTRVSWG